MTTRTNGINLRLFGNLRVMVASALFVALSIVFGKFLAFNIGDSIRISFENLPIILAGIAFGPIIGATVGISADLIGCLLKGYAINPYITAGAITIGAVAGICHIITTGRMKSVYSIALSVFTAHILGSMIIKSIGLHLYYGTPLPVLLTRIPLYIVIGTLETYILVNLLKSSAIQKLLFRSKEQNREG